MCVPFEGLRGAVLRINWMLGSIYARQIFITMTPKDVHNSTQASTVPVWAGRRVPGAVYVCQHKCKHGVSMRRSVNTEIIVSVSLHSDRAQYRWN